MKTLFPIAALAGAALVFSVANADTIHRNHRAGAGSMRQTAAPMPPPTSFQSLYQGGYQGYGPYDCEERVFGYCPVR